MRFSTPKKHKALRSRRILSSTFGQVYAVSCHREWARRKRSIFKQIDSHFKNVTQVLNYFKKKNFIYILILSSDHCIQWTLLFTNFVKLVFILSAYWRHIEKSCKEANLKTRHLQLWGYSKCFLTNPVTFFYETERWYSLKKLVLKVVCDGSVFHKQKFTKSFTSFQCVS